ncbi:hypothetical protein B296_00034389, partial [Ensete ventricosum]
LLTLTPLLPPSPALGYRLAADANRCPAASTTPPATRFPCGGPRRTSLPPSLSQSSTLVPQPLPPLSLLYSAIVVSTAAKPSSIAPAPAASQPSSSPPLQPLLPAVVAASSHALCHRGPLVGPPPPLPPLQEPLPTTPLAAAPLAATAAAPYCHRCHSLLLTRLPQQPLPLPAVASCYHHCPTISNQLFDILVILTPTSCGQVLLHL